MQSALEKEILQVLLRFRAWLGIHDRAVLLGLLLSIPPIFPVPLIGLMLALFHYWLWTQRKLEQHEIGLIRVSLVLSTLSSIAAITLVYCIFKLASTSTVEGSGLVVRVWETLTGYLHSFLNLTPFHRNQVAI